MTEKWIPVVGWEGMYEVSSYGVLRSLRKEVLMTGRLCNRTGYLRVNLNRGSVKVTKHIHQIVAEAFLNHVPSGLDGNVVDHKNRDRLNNRVSNLQLISQDENLRKRVFSSNENDKNTCPF
jgi:hypothetical protein